MKKNKSLVKPILIFFLLSLFSLPAYAYELVIPSLDYRTGPYAPNGIPVANGFSDYLKMLNARDGGINGVPIKMFPAKQDTIQKLVSNVMRN